MKTLFKLFLFLIICFINQKIYSQCPIIEKLNNEKDKFKIFHDTKNELSWGNFRSDLLKTIFEKAKTLTNFGFILMRLDLDPDQRAKIRFFNSYFEEYQKATNEFEIKRILENCEKKLSDLKTKLNKSDYYIISEKIQLGGYDFNSKSFPYNFCKSIDYTYPGFYYHVYIEPGNAQLEVGSSSFHTSLKADETWAESFVKKYPDRKVMVYSIYHKPYKVVDRTSNIVIYDFYAKLFGFIVVKNNEVIFAKNYFVEENESMIRECERNVKGWNDFLKNNPNDKNALENLKNNIGSLGWYYYLLSDYPHSVINSKKALEIDPKFYMVRFNLGLSTLCMGDIEAAITEYKNALSVCDNKNTINAALNDLEKANERIPKLKGYDDIIKLFKK